MSTLILILQLYATLVAVCICEVCWPTRTGQAMPCDSDPRAFLADLNAMVFTMLPWAFPDLDDAE